MQGLGGEEVLGAKPWISVVVVGIWSGKSTLFWLKRSIGCVDTIYGAWGCLGCVEQVGMLVFVRFFWCRTRMLLLKTSRWCTHA